MNPGSLSKTIESISPVQRQINYEEACKVLDVVHMFGLKFNVHPDVPPNEIYVVFETTQGLRVQKIILTAS